MNYLLELLPDEEKFKDHLKLRCTRCEHLKSFHRTNWDYDSTYETCDICQDENPEAISCFSQNDDQDGPYYEVLK